MAQHKIDNRGDVLNQASVQNIQGNQNMGQTTRFAFINIQLNIIPSIDIPYQDIKRFLQEWESAHGNLAAQRMVKISLFMLSILFQAANTRQKALIDILSIIWSGLGYLYLSIDLRWSGLALFEDALGDTHKIECFINLKQLERNILEHFENLPGSEDVARGNFELFDPASYSLYMPSSQILPGMRVTMAIVLERPAVDDGLCPKSKCRSNRLLLVPGKVQQCQNCNAVFGASKKKLNRVDDYELHKSVVSGSNPEVGIEERLKNIRFDENKAAKNISPTLRRSTYGGSWNVNSGSLL